MVDGGTFTLTGKQGSSGAQCIIGGGRFEVTGGATVKINSTGSSSSIVACGTEIAVTNGVFDFMGISGEFLNAMKPTVSDPRLGSVQLSGTSTFTIADEGVVSGKTFRVTQNSTSGQAGIINLNKGGILSLGRFKCDGASYRGAINFNGGRLMRQRGWSGRLFAYDTGSESTKWAAVTANVCEGGVHFVDGGNGTTFNLPLVGAAQNIDGGIHITCPGDYTVTLARTNSYNGGTSINTGRVAIAFGRSLGADPMMPETNFWFKSDSGWLSSMAVHSNRIFAVADGGVAQFAASTNSALVLHGTVDCPAANVRVTGNLLQSSGVTAFDPGEGRTNDAYRLIVEGVAEVRSGDLRLRCSTGEYGANSTLYINNDNATTFTNWATLRITGGNVKLDGGHVQIAHYGQLTVEDAMVDFSSCASFFNAHGSPGRIAVGAGGVLDMPSTFRISQSWTDPAEVCLMTGGVMKIEGFIIDTNTGKFPANLDFDGGTIVAKATSSTFFGNSSTDYSKVHVRVMKGGATIDTGGNAVRIFRPFEAGDDGAGGLTKKGDGCLILNAPCSYAGATYAEEGILRLGCPVGTLPSTTTLVLGTNGVCQMTCDHTGSSWISAITSTQTVARLEGCGNMDSCRNLTVTDAVSPGIGVGGVGTLTLSHACALSGDFEFDMNETGGDSVKCNSGVLNISGLALKVNSPEEMKRLYYAPNCPKSHTLVSSTGGIAGTFAACNLDSGKWRLSYTATSVTLHRVKGLCVSFR